MGKIRAEYIWMDGHQPTSKLRSKTKVVKLSLLYPLILNIFKLPLLEAARK